MLTFARRPCAKPILVSGWATLLHGRLGDPTPIYSLDSILGPVRGTRRAVSAAALALLRAAGAREFRAKPNQAGKGGRGAAEPIGTGSARTVGRNRPEPVGRLSWARSRGRHRLFRSGATQPCPAHQT